MSGAPPHRLVIDPNMFISATITPNGALGPIIRLIDDGTLVPVVTQHLVDEVVDVLGRPKSAKCVRCGAGAAFEEQMRRLGEWRADVVGAAAGPCACLYGSVATAQRHRGPPTLICWR